MGLNVNYEFLFVGKDDNSFLENYAYDLFQEHGEKSGQIFVNLEIQNNPVDAEDIGAAIFETMQGTFFEDVELDAYERFEHSMKAVNEVLSKFMKEKSSGYIGSLNIVVAAIVDGNLFLTKTGDSEAYLIRKRYVSIVSEGLGEDDNNDVFTSIASGKIEKGDFILFSTARLLRYIGKTDLAQAVTRKGLSESLSDIKDIISTEMLGRLGFTGMTFEEATKDDVKAIEEGVDMATKNVLASDGDHLVTKKETLTGRFLSMVKGYKKRQGAMYDGGSGVMSSIKNFFGRMYRGLFSEGFGKDKVLALLVIVIIVLLAGVWFAGNQRATREELRKLDSALNNVQEKIAEAETKGAYDKEMAKEILDKAYLDALEVLNSGYYRDKAKVFLIQIDQTRDKLDNVQRIASPKKLADLSEKRSDVNALGFATVGDRVFVYEANGLYEIVLDQVQDPLTIDDDEVVIAATGFDDRKSVVFLTKSGKLIEYKDGAMNFMDTDDGQFRKAVDIADWSNKVYLLDADGSQIWKYSYKGTREKFGSAEAYIADDQDVDLTLARSLTIDSNIFVLDSSGGLSKYYAGQKAEFFVNNAPYSSIKDPAVVYTDEKLDQVFVLDGDESKVLIYRKDSKTGNVEYQSQYLFEGVGDLRDLYVDPDTRKMYVLSENGVYEQDI